MIRFKFDPVKALQAMAYIVERLHSVDKVVLMKLLYLADSEHFLANGYPITGDRQVAMPLGPLPSGCLNLFDVGRFDGVNTFEFLHLDDFHITCRKSPGVDRLGATEKRQLDKVIREHGHKPAWNRRGSRGLVEETHALPEYIENYKEGTSTTIPYESILRHRGDASHFRHNRPVISEAMAQHMVSDFRADPDDDL